jgi:Patatin-like phospholipase
MPMAACTAAWPSQQPEMQFSKEAAMQNNILRKLIQGVWRIYATRERGWFALYFLVLFIFVQAFFSHPDFIYREANKSCVVSLQLAFTVSKFKSILLSWQSIAIFKRSVLEIDFIFPPVYAGLLAFGYAWSRRNTLPGKLDRFFFLAPVAAAAFDYIENCLHLYLLRGVDMPAQVEESNFPAALVIAASTFALLKIILFALVAGVILFWRLPVAIFRNLPRLAALLPYVYLLRFPALTAIGLVGLVYLSFFTGARSLLENLFDLRTWGIYWVTLVAFLIAWAIMATSRLLLLYGPRRFKVIPCRVSKKIHWGYFTRYGLIALPIVAGAVLKSGAQAWNGYVGATLMTALGLATSLCTLWGAMWLQRFFAIPNNKSTSDPEKNYVDLLLPSPRPGQRLLNAAHRSTSLAGATKRLSKRLETIFALLGRGYINRNGEILEGHLLAISLLIASLVIYAGIGIVKYAWLGDDSGIPALSYALWLLLLFNWGLSALSFFFDRYRLPVLIPLTILLILTAQISHSDYYYKPLPLEEPPTPKPGELRASLPAGQPLLPADVIQSKKQGDQEADNKASLIVVAVSGGGIQAAAWAAQVLTGLERENPGKFGRRVRLISSVSGGSVGAMYFVNAYQDGSLDETGLSSVMEQAMHSSINAVAWGLVYPDFLRAFCPFCFSSIDRGQALEEAWLRADKQTKASLGQATLAKWREDALQHRRPAVIFNTTITDTGERLLLATSAPGKGSQDGVGNQAKGSRSFSDLYPKHDLKIVTAARLSAAFPYVSPAARADLPGRQFHIVDGGYYDNYGISSLAQWLDEALPPCGSVRRLLILQIRAFPIEIEDKRPQNQPATRRGWFYQAFAPVSTLLNVRTAGQSAHNQVELKLLRQALENRGVTVESADFEFRSSDKSSSCKRSEDNYNPPLSWHLTTKQKAEIKGEWDRIERCIERQKVKNFLNSDSLQTINGGVQQSRALAVRSNN